MIAAAEAIPQNDYSWRALSTIADRLLELRDPRAGAVVEHMLRGSRAAGWSSHYDGGSRLRAYELLIRVSGEQGRHAAWDALRNDIAAGEVRPRDVLNGWDRIVAVLAPGTSTVDIWNVVAQHVEALVSCAPKGEPLELPAAEDPSDPAAAAEAVCGLVARYLDHHAIPLAQGAHQFFTDRLLAGDAVAERTLAARLADVNVPKSGSLLVLRAAARVRGTVALPLALRDALRSLRQSPSFPDRRAAVGLLGNDEGSSGDTGAGTRRIVSPPGIEPPLPAVFRLVHPPAPLRERPPPARGAMLEPAEDAADFVSIFRAELDLIAGWSGVQPEALYRYVADAAVASLPIGSRNLAFDDEPALREELRRLGLKVTYRRPRPRRVERAMAEATAMLVDHGRLGKRHFRALDRLFRNADPYFLVARATQRPSIIAPIRERAGSRFVGDDWTSGVSTQDAVTGRTIATIVNASVERQRKIRTESKPPRETNWTTGPGRPEGTPDGEWIVLAEETWVRWLDWKQATETRIGARLEPRIWAAINPKDDSRETLDPGDFDGDAAANQALAAHIAEFSHLTADEYLTEARAPYSIIVGSLTYRFETPTGRWLAINPALAVYLGWRPAPDGLFRWLDSEAEVVAESIWWQDGFVQQRPPLFEDEVGHGWLVRVSANGWRQLSAAVGACVDWQRVARLAQEQAPKGTVEWNPVPAAPTEHHGS